MRAAGKTSRSISSFSNARGGPVMRKAWSGHERVKCENNKKTQALSRKGLRVMKSKRPEDASSKDITNILRISVGRQPDSCDCWWLVQGNSWWQGNWREETAEFILKPSTPASDLTSNDSCAENVWPKNDYWETKTTIISSVKPIRDL